MICRTFPPASRVACASLLAVLLTGCTRFELFDATIPSKEYDRTRSLIYGDAPRQTLDVYRPHHAKQPAKVVIFFYGGDWQNGSKADYRFVAQALTTRGFIAVLPDYRLYPSVVFPAFVDDGALATRWVHDNIKSFGGDPSHIYLMGHSAGAHIASLLTLDQRYLKSVGLDRNAIRGTAALSGPYDFVPSVEDRGAFGMSPNQTTVNPDMEPINFVDGHAPPMLLVQGLKDDVVGSDNTQKLAAKIQASGGEVQTIYYPDRGHAGVVQAFASPFRWLAPVLKDTAAFFNAH
ncbi:MAG TPA: alpha/beta hydrolase [Tepidisphaeraceae bacterium]|jgi:acetyl esterase/lipase